MTHHIYKHEMKWEFIPSIVQSIIDNKQLVKDIHYKYSGVTLVINIQPPSFMDILMYRKFRKTTCSTNTSN